MISTLLFSYVSDTDNVQYMHLWDMAFKNKHGLQLKGLLTTEKIFLNVIFPDKTSTLKHKAYIFSLSCICFVHSCLAYLLLFQQ